MGVAAALSVTGVLSAQTSTSPNAPPSEVKPKAQAKAQVGEAAPDFTVKDAEGKEHKLSDYKGKIVVLQWVNPDCPICRRVHEQGLVQDMRTQLKELDPEVVHLAINTTYDMEAEKSAKYLARHKIDSPVLIDQEGTVGRLYGAKTTPHLFVIDQEGVLRYDGAIDDDSPRGTKGKSAKNYAVNAVRQIVEGETVIPDSTTPYGCNVKYKPAS